MNGQARPVLLGATGLVILGVVWELAVRMFDIRPFVLQAPTEIARTFADDPGMYLKAAAETGVHAVAGLAIALVFSLLVGSALAASKPLEEASQPVLMLVLVAPWVAYYGSIRAAIGLGTAPVIVLVSMVTIPAFTFAMVAGLRAADPAARELFESISASRWEVLWRLRMPTAAPVVLATARFNSGLALAAAYYAEGPARSRTSLGSIGLVAQAHSLGDVLWTTIIVTAALGFLFLALITGIERTVLGWHVSQRD